jgi:hypothetical protein
MADFFRLIVPTVTYQRGTLIDPDWFTDLRARRRAQLGESKLM